MTATTNALPLTSTARRDITLAQLHAVATNETLPMALRIAALQEIEANAVSLEFLMATEQDVLGYTSEHGASVEAR
jgi:hypothetical protein